MKYKTYFKCGEHEEKVSVEDNDLKEAVEIELKTTISREQYEKIKTFTEENKYYISGIIQELINLDPWQVLGF